MKLKCAICRREKDESAMTVFSPTHQEKLAMKRLGEEEVLDQYAYCRGCIGILSDPNTAISLMKGVVQVQARSVGVPVSTAEAIADRYGKKLMAVTPAKPRS